MLFRPHRFSPPLGPPRRSPRERAMAELYGLDPKPVEVARALTAKKVADLMPKVLGQIRMEKRQGETEIVRVWNNIMDPNVTAHAQPTGFNATTGTLFVTIDSSVWLDEIVRYRRKEILDRLHHSFGRELVKKISFRVG